MYRTLSDRHAGDLYGTQSHFFCPHKPLTNYLTRARYRFAFWEASQDGATGEIRFRRQTQLVSQSGGRGGDLAATTALPMTLRVRPQQRTEDRFVERFEAHDIVSDHEGESMHDDGIHSTVTEDDKPELEWAHAR